MKYSNIQAFKKHLEEARPQHLADVYTIISPDAFERKNAVDSLTRILLGDEANPALSLKVFDAERALIQDIIEELNALSFFATKRVILIQQADKLPKPALKALESYMKHPNSAIYLVIAATALHKGTTFYKQAEKLGVVLELAEEKPWIKEKALAQQIVMKVQGEGKKIQQQACQVLLQQIGTDSASIHQELEKLLCYIGERDEITTQDVAAICTRLNVEDGWQLGDALFGCDAKGALRIAKGLFEDGAPFLGLLRQMRSQFQTKYQICSIIAQGGQGNDVSQHFPYMKGRILDRNMQLASQYGMARFKKGILNIDRTELLVKNSMIDHHVLLETLIVKLTT